GLICYSDEREQYIKPKKGLGQAYQIISHLEKLHTKSKRTNLAKAISFALNSIKRRSVIVMISDFIDEGYERNLQSLARKHDLVVIHISDKRETHLPKLGIIPALDKESGQTLWINTSFGQFRDQLSHAHTERQEAIRKFSRKHQINYLAVNTDEDFVPKLLRLFKVRNKSLKSS
ncbi:MAG: DUF58 domain-containing protein, partial [Cyclobacteriaceae bacterium]|nr:DUF58 domain-containing protein [Cyclobacteriaceae bacterium]